MVCVYCLVDLVWVWWLSCACWFVIVYCGEFGFLVEFGVVILASCVWDGCCALYLSFCGFLMRFVDC